MEEFTRRNFIKTAATFPAAGGCLYTLSNVGPLQCGVVGLGRQGIRLIEAVDPKFIRIKGVYDEDLDTTLFKLDEDGKEEIPEWFQQHHAKRYLQLEELLQDRSIDAIVIATPFMTHFEIAKKALQAGKHVFVERMMAAKPEQCRAMTSLAQQNKLLLQVGHPYFYSLLFWDAFQVINSKLLGSIYHCRIETNSLMKEEDHLNKHFISMGKELAGWQLDRDQSYGVWSEACCNWLGWIQGLFPNHAPLAVQVGSNAVNTSPGISIDVNVFAMLEYENNLIVSLSNHHDRRGIDDDYLLIMGTWGSLKISFSAVQQAYWIEYSPEPGFPNEEQLNEFQAKFIQTQVEIVPEINWNGVINASPTPPPYSYKFEPYLSSKMQAMYQDELRGFAHSIRSGKPCFCDGVMGMQIANTCYAAQLAAQTKQRVLIES